MAMQPLGHVAAFGSKAATAAALEGRPMVELLTGTKVPWEAAMGRYLTHESVDGAYVAADIPGMSSTSAWMGRYPPLGGMWKRIRTN